MAANPELLVLLYAHPSVCEWLRQGGAGHSATHPIAEVALGPTLAPALGLRTPADYPGLTGLLEPGLSLAQLALRKPVVNQCFIPAPGTAVAPVHFAWSVARWRTQATGPLTLLLRLTDAEVMSETLALADGVAVYWDFSLPLPPGAERVFELLAAEGFLQPPQWRGWYSKPGPVANEAWLQARLTAVGQPTTLRHQWVGAAAR